MIVCTAYNRSNSTLGEFCLTSSLPTVNMSLMPITKNIHFFILILRALQCDQVGLSLKFPHKTSQNIC